MLLRAGEPSATSDVVAAASVHFRQVVTLEDDGRRTFTVGGLEYVHDPTHRPPFVLVPQCETCGDRSLDQFLFEDWMIGGVVVRGQAHTTCRNCRFLAIASGSGPPIVLDALPDPGVTAAPLAAWPRPMPARPADEAERPVERLLLTASLVVLVMSLAVAASSHLELWDSRAGRFLGTVVAVIALALAGVGLWWTRERHGVVPRWRLGEGLSSAH